MGGRKTITSFWDALNLLLLMTYTAHCPEWVSSIYKLECIESVIRYMLYMVKVWLQLLATLSPLPRAKQ